MAEEKFKVVINLYDLSGGMAKVFSPMFLGKQIEGIWHTGVCVYNREYYFGGGICSSNIKQTPYGVPIKEIPLGETEIPQELFEQYLQEISPQYTMEKYDLFTNNCNNFSDECAHFLVGEKLPSYITGLPKEVLDTPIGNMLKPVIDNMQNQVVQQSGQANMFPQAFEGQSNDQQLFPNQNQNQQNQNQQQQQQQQQPIFPTGNQSNEDLINLFNKATQMQGGNANSGTFNNTEDMKKVEEIDGFMDFIEKTTTTPACIIDFYSKTCGPCKIIKPIYCSLSEQHPEIKFYIVDGMKNQDITQQFQIQGFPTFVTFVNGGQDQKWVGANQTKLIQKINELKEKLPKSNSENTEKEQEKKQESQQSQQESTSNQQ